MMLSTSLQARTRTCTCWQVRTAARQQRLATCRVVATAAAPAVPSAKTTDLVELGRTGAWWPILFVLAGIAARVLCAGALPVLLVRRWWCLSRWCEPAGLKVSALGIGAWTWGDRTGYWGFEQQGRPDGYGEEENRCCISPAPSTALALWS